MMPVRYYPFAYVLAIILVVTTSAPSRAVAPEIKDDAGFFSAEVIKKANDSLRDLSQKYRKDVLIETYKQVPAADVDKVKSMSREEKQRYFSDWCKQRVEARVVEGVIILICKDPPQLQSGVSERSLTTFDKSTRGKIDQLVLGAFREKKYDEGLTAALKFLAEHLAETSSARPKEQK